MRTLIVAIDFYENSFDAAQYVLDWLPQLNVDKVILFHSDVSMDIPENILLGKLGDIKRKLPQVDKVSVECVTTRTTLTEGISALIKKYHASLVVMGITGKNKVRQKLIGSNVFEVLQHIDIPVLIIPAKTQFKKTKKIALALPIIPDLKNHIPYDEIKLFIQPFDAELMVVNVGRSNDKTTKSVLYSGLSDMFDMFDDLTPSYHFLTDNNTANSIASFAKDNDAQLLIGISGRYRLLQGMFKSSVTKKMAYNSAVPLLFYKLNQ